MSADVDCDRAPDRGALLTGAALVAAAGLLFAFAGVAIRMAGATLSSIEILFVPILGFLLFRFPFNRTVLIAMAIGFFAAALAWLLWDERADWFMAAGTALIIAASFIALRAGRQSQLTRPDRYPSGTGGASK